MGQIQTYGYYNLICWDKGQRTKRYPKNLTAIDNLSDNDDYILFLKFEGQYSIPNIDYLIVGLQPILEKNDKTFIILTPSKDAPLITASEDEYVFSFCCSLNHLKSVMRSLKLKNVFPRDLLFELLDKMGRAYSPFERIIVKQFPFEDTLTLENVPCDVVVPHRGKSAYLQTVLYFLEKIGNLSTFVGIDQKRNRCVENIIHKYSSFNHYNFSPAPVGPYVIRNRLINQGNNNLVFFQDSDDIPCYDRFSTLGKYLEMMDCQMCGSHELRINYFKRAIQAVRFPIDVKAALKDEPLFPLLHPSSCITRQAFYSCGMLSEERKFGNDTKFLLYSYFVLNRIFNFPEFLYIRKVHSGSLTTSPETMLNSPLRRNLNYQWNCDFQGIKSGLLSLENSSLTPIKSRLKIEMWKYIQPEILNV